MEKITIIGWVILLAFILIFTTRFVIKLIKTERKRKTFISTLKKGDKVIVPCSSGYYGEVIEINDDEVKIVVKAPRNVIYPQ